MAADTDSGVSRYSVVDADTQLEVASVTGTSTTIAGLAPGSVHHYSVKAYDVAGNISYALSDSWALFAGAQFESVGQYTQTLKGQQATLDLRRLIFVTVGVSYSF